MTRRILIEADGGSRGNPGPAGSGAALLDMDTGRLLAEIALFIGVASNNVAEYRAVLAAVQLANELDPTAELLVRLDSKLIVEQMSGRWKIKHESMLELSNQLNQALGTRTVSFEWVPREQNTRADALANEAMDSQQSAIRKFQPEPGTASIDVVTSAGQVTAADLEYHPELPSSVRAPRNIESKLTTVILVRHGRTTLTESHRLSGRGGVNPQLSALGIEDAQRVAAELAKVGKSGTFAKLATPSALVCSPLARTVETAQYIGAELRLVPETLPEIEEISFGVWDGHTNQEVASIWPVEFGAWRGDVKIAPPGGESLEEFDSRVQQGRAKILQKYAGQTVIVVAHVMPIRGFLKAATVADWPIYWRASVAPCSITVLRFWGDEAAEISAVNSTSHL